jgi:hypothetical protein
MKAASSKTKRWLAARAVDAAARIHRSSENCGTSKTIEKAFSSAR